MKKLLFFFLLFITLESSAQDSSKVKITGWHYESNVTSMQVQFEFGWCVFLLEGNHVGDEYKMLTEGCNVVKRIGLYHFYPVPGLGYVKAKDEDQIKRVLGVKVLCNGDVPRETSELFNH